MNQIIRDKLNRLDELVGGIMLVRQQVEKNLGGGRAGTVGTNIRMPHRKGRRTSS